VEAVQFTKLGHSCVRLEKNGAVLVIDPGVFTDAPAALNFATAVLVTHEHPDHLDADAVREALLTDADLTLWATPAVADQFRTSATGCTGSATATPWPSPVSMFTPTARSTR